MAGVRSAMRSPMRSAISQALGTAYMSLANQAIAVLRKFGTNAHVYLPGANGVPVSGLLSNNYTSNDGSTGLSAIDGTCGLVLDGAGAVGAELSTVQSASPSGTTGNVCTSANSAVANATYLVTFDYNISLGSVQANIGNIANTTKTGVGTATVICTPTSGGAIAIGCNAATGSVSNFSVKQVTGIHASQSSGAARPGVRRGLYNLLTYSNDLSNVIWGKNTVVTSGSAPMWTATATSTIHALAYGVPGTSGAAVVAGQAYTFAFYAQSGTMTDAKYSVYNITGAANVIAPTSYIAQLNPTSPQLVVVQFTAPAGCTQVGLYQLRDSGVTGTTLIGATGLFAGTLTSAQILAEGSIPLTTSAAASNQSAGRYSWQFDGSNDSLALGSVPFQMADDSCVVLACRPDAATKYAFQVGNGTTTVVTSIGINSSGYPFAQWTDDAATTDQLVYSANKIGSVYVVAARKVGNSKTLWVDGVQRASGSAVMGTTTLTAAAIGSNATSVSLWWSGLISEPIVIKGTVSDADLLTLMRQVAANTPAGPVF